jgi:16S rRNA (guanine966-N2)-methyltransferase
MRVIAGSRRSLPLKTLEGDATRPTADKYKETLFNCIQMDVPGSVFMDLFSGSGSIAIEALSRGASHAVLVENSRAAAEVIKYNVHFTKFDDSADIIQKDAVTYVRNLPKVDFDIIYIDPPYNKGLEKAVMLELNQKTFSSEDAIIIVESALEEDFSYIENTKFEVYKVKEYKTNKHVFIRIR